MSISFPIVLHRIFTGVLCGHRIFLGLCRFLTSNFHVPRIWYSPVLSEMWSLYMGVLHFRLSLVVSWVWFHQWCIIIEWNNWCFCWCCYHLTLLLFCFNRTMESVNWSQGDMFLLLKACQDITSCIMIQQNLVRCAKTLYDVKEWTIIRDIQLCPKNPTATAAAEKTIFDRVLCNKSFSKIHFYSCYPFVYLLVFSRFFWIYLRPSLPPHSSLIVSPYPFDPGRWNAHDFSPHMW